MNLLKGLFSSMLIVTAIAIISACYHINRPPDNNLPEPPAHKGVFISELDTLIFTGDGQTIEWSISNELATTTELPQKAKGTYVFKFNHYMIRYDEAEYLQLTYGTKSYRFRLVDKAQSEHISIISPIDAKKNISFIKK